MKWRGLLAVGLVLLAVLLIACLVTLLPNPATLSKLAPGVHAEAMRVSVVDMPVSASAVMTGLHVAISKTVGLEPTRCATQSSIVVPTGSLVYFCLTVVNTGDVTITSQIFDDPLLGLNKIPITQSLSPGAQLVITDHISDQRPLSTNVTADLTNTVFLTATSGISQVVAQAQASAKIGKVAIAVTHTVGLDPLTCAAHSTIDVSRGSTLYYCITVKNNGTLTLTQFSISDSLLGLNQNLTHTLTLKPAEQLVITDGNLRSLFPSITASLVVSNAQTPMTNTIVLTALTADGLGDSQSASTHVNVGDAVIGVFKYLEKDPNSCAPTSSLTITSGEPIYYCLRVENRGQVTLITHRISESATNINATFTYTLAPNAILTITNNLLTSALNASAVLGPFTFNTNVVNVLTFSSTTADGITTSANASAALNVAPLTTLPTLTPTPSLTPIPSATDTPSTVPSATPTPTTTPTVPPTATAAPVVVSLLPIPTPTANFLIATVTTPTGGVQAQQNQSPLATPFSPNSPLATPPLPTPIIDNAAVEATQAAEADATATGLALLAPPTPFPTETPTLEPTLTETTTPSPLPLVAAARPIEYPSPAPAPDFITLFAKVVDASAVAAGWIWFLCGSLIFFVTAGVLAGLGLRHQKRPRYGLVDSDDDLYQTVAAPQSVATAASPAPAKSELADDDYWPTSLP